MLAQPICSWQTILQMWLSLLSFSLCWIHPSLWAKQIKGPINKSINPSFSLSSRGTYSGHTVCFCSHSGEPHQASQTRRTHWRCWPLTQWTVPVVVISALRPLKILLALPARPSFPWKVLCEFASSLVAAASPLRLVTGNSLGRRDGIKDHPHLGIGWQAACCNIIHFTHFRVPFSVHSANIYWAPLQG